MLLAALSDQECLIRRPLDCRNLDSIVELLTSRQICLPMLVACELEPSAVTHMPPLAIAKYSLRLKPVHSPLDEAMPAKANSQ
jgi:hypothetical protein